MPIIFDSVTKKFGGLTVLNHFSTVISDGEVVCIMGPSGVGKTTLLHLLLGTILPEEGNIDTGGKILKYSVVFQEDRLCESFDALTNIRMVVNDKVSSRLISNQLEAVGIYETTMKPVSEFSGGMKRRVAIVRALLSKSDIIIMDEPFKGLNEELKINIIQYIKEKREGRTLLIVTHDKSDAVHLEARVLDL